MYTNNLNNDIYTEIFYIYIDALSNVFIKCVKKLIFFVLLTSFYLFCFA